MSPSTPLTTLPGDPPNSTRLRPLFILVTFL
jgi:hypothetical protein